MKQYLLLLAAATLATTAEANILHHVKNKVVDVGGKVGGKVKDTTVHVGGKVAQEVGHQIVEHQD